MSIGPVSGAGAAHPVTRGTGAVGGASKPRRSEFEEHLDAAIRGVSESQAHADDELSRLATGESFDIHNTMIALQEADVSLRTMVAVRDKVAEAYQQVMNMTI